MSFLCVALIAGVAIPLLEQTVEPFVRGLRNLDALAWDGSLPPRVAQFRVDLRMLLRRVGMLTHRLRLRFVIRRIVVFSLHGGFRLMELGAFSLVMQFGMALPMAYYFHRATSVAVFANLLAVPFLQVLLPAAAIATALSYISLALARLPATLATFAMTGIAGTVRWLGGMRIADVRLPTPTSASILLASAAIFTAVIFSRTKNRLRLASLIFLAVSATAVWEIPPAEQVRAGILEMTAIDVGQGDSLFLAFPDGHKVLVDAGGLPFWAHSRLDVGEDVVSPYLWARGISRLDAVALTHAHADHMGGLFSVMENFHPREFWLPEGIPDEEIRNLLDGARRDHIKIVYRKAGDSFNYGGAQIRVLAPDPEFPIRVAHRNDESLVMKIAYRKTSVLLEADAEKGTEQLVAAEHPEADVLKVAHHGSATSSEPQLLAAVHPRFAVISVGVHNVYHHPRREVLERLRQWNVRTYRTDLDGATSFYLDGLQVAVAAN